LGFSFKASVWWQDAAIDVSVIVAWNIIAESIDGGQQEPEEQERRRKPGFFLAPCRARFSAACANTNPYCYGLESKRM